MKNFLNILKAGISLLILEFTILTAAAISVWVFVLMLSKTGLAAVGLFFLSVIIMAVAFLLFIIVGSFAKSFIVPDTFTLNDIVRSMQNEKYQFSIQNNILKVTNGEDTYYMKPNGSKCTSYMFSSYVEECKDCECFESCTRTGKPEKVNDMS